MARKYRKLDSVEVQLVDIGGANIEAPEGGSGVCGKADMERTTSVSFPVFVAVDATTTSTMAQLGLAWLNLAPGLEQIEKVRSSHWDERGHRRRQEGSPEDLWDWGN